MHIACLVIAAMFLAAALYSARQALRVRGWPRIKASIVHWKEAGPFGKPFSRTSYREVIVIAQDGTERTVRPYPNPEIVYYAELVYTWEGRPYAADLVFDQPVADTFELLINPDNPADYLPHNPSLYSSSFLAILGLVFLVIAL